jgi:type IV pilus assembly protein PilO
VKLEDFNNIDFKNAGSLPMPVKTVLLSMIFIFITALGYYFIWMPALESLDTEKQKEESLKQVFLEKKGQAINLVAYKQQMIEIEKTFGALLKQLPDKSQVDALLTDINQAGLERGLEFELFKPEAEIMSEFYAEMPISIRVIGKYHDIGAFATSVSKLSRIVTLKDVSITNVPKENKNGGAAPPPSQDDMLVMEATARTYRYLDTDEIKQGKSDLQANAGAPH